MSEEHSTNVRMSEEHSINVRKFENSKNKQPPQVLYLASYGRDRMNV